MFIPITIPSHSPSTSPLPPQIAKLGNDDLVLIELQGALDVECTENSERNGQVVGTFRFDEGSSKPTLAIGHHLLEGKIVSLPKPLGVIQRSTAPSPHSSLQGALDHDPEDDDMDGEKAKKSQGDQSQWEMVAIVKKKIVFSKRPMPIVGKVEVILGRKAE